MQDAFAPGTLFVPQQHSSTPNLDLASVHSQHFNLHADQQMQGSQPNYMQTDSALFQHYADMGLAQGSMTSMLTADLQMTPAASFALEPSLTGQQQDIQLARRHASGAWWLCFASVVSCNKHDLKS